MKKLFSLFIFCFFCASILFSQKNDYLWRIAGSDWLGPYLDTNSFTIDLDFRNQGLTFEKPATSSAFNSKNICISDTAGNLLATFDGCSIYTADGAVISTFDSTFAVILDTIHHFDVFGSSNSITEYCSDAQFTKVHTHLSIPLPKNLKKHYIFYHINWNDFDGGVYQYSRAKTFYTIFDFTNPEIPVCNKGQVLFEDSIKCFNAVKHANGRDYWILGFGVKGKIHRKLLTDKGLIDFPDQLQPTGLFNKTFLEKSNFSADGSKYAIWQIAGVAIWDFDRCDGLFSNETSFRYDSCFHFAGIAPQPPLYNPRVRPVFSPNGRFLYLTTQDFETCNSFNNGHKKIDGGRVIQYDLWENGFPYHGDTVAYVAHFIAPWIPPYMILAHPLELYNGPDGRIYSPSFPNFINTIELPNKKGMACDVRIRKYATHINTTYAWPTFPHYRLGPIDGSSCDTLGINNNPLCDWRYEEIDSNLLKVEFTDNSFYEPATWYWNFGDGTTSQDTNPVHIFSNPGVYQVCLTVCNQFSCDTLCQNVIIGILANETPESLTDLLVYPNPASKNIIIQLPTAYRFGNYQISIKNILGQTLKTQTMQGNQTEIDVSNLPNGLVFVQILIDGKIKAVEKIVISN